MKELKDTGNRMSLSSYDLALDHLLRSLAQMTSDHDMSAVDSFISRPQMLRAVGAPGLGKSTFVKSAWTLLLQRLAEVETDEERWQRWQRLGAVALKERMLKSWTTSFGSLVFTIDMSDQCEWVCAEDQLLSGSFARAKCKNTTCNVSPFLLAVLRQVMDLEKSFDPDVQIAARMLWAAVDCKCDYSSFLTRLNNDFPYVLRRLHPLTIQYFVHLAAGLAEDQPSIIVFVWDEANTVHTSPNIDEPTFFQLQLAEVVDSRVSALKAIRRNCSPGLHAINFVAQQAIDVLLVPVAASTRGSAMSLFKTSSKKAGCTDLRLPLIQSVDDSVLISMDLLRRLPLPIHIRNSVLPDTIQREGALHTLPSEVGEGSSFICVCLSSFSRSAIPHSSRPTTRHRVDIYSQSLGIFPLLVSGAARAHASLSSTC